MRSALKNYLGMLAIAIGFVLVIGAIGVRIDRAQVYESPDGIEATPALIGNTPNGLVDAPWLMQHVAEVDYIFDLADLGVYEVGHIPGAVHVWWQDAMALHPWEYSRPDRISAPSSSDPVFGRLNLHVPQNARIVLYDSNQSERASWMLWVMRINGYTDVHVLDGGLPAWIGAGGELSTDSTDSRDHELVTEQIWDESQLIEEAELLAKLDDPNLMLIDTRSTEQLQDTVNETIPVGHIPGAINIPTAEVMRPDGTFKPPAELHRGFESIGITQDADIVVYSLYPLHSGQMWLALHLAGFEEAVIFADGFYGWGLNTDLPIATEALPATPVVATPVVTPDLSPTATPAESTPDDEGPTDLTGD